MSFQRKITVSTLIVLTILTGCTLYQSDGRKCIAEGCSSFVSTESSFASEAQKSCKPFPNNFDAQKANWYYVPDTNKQNINAYIETNQNQTKLIVTYKEYDEKNSIGYLCEFYFEDQFGVESQMDEKIQKAHSYLKYIHNS